jgi:hypothetical protein
VVKCFLNERSSLAVLFSSQIYYTLRKLHVGCRKTQINENSESEKKEIIVEKIIIAFWVGCVNEDFL